MNKGVQNFLAGKTDSLSRSVGAPIQFRRPAAPAVLVPGEQKRTVTQDMMEHLGPRDPADARISRSNRTVNL
jgi:hypothetical protein